MSLKSSREKMNRHCVAANLPIFFTFIRYSKNKNIAIIRL